MQEAGRMRQPCHSSCLLTMHRDTFLIRMCQIYLCITLCALADVVRTSSFPAGFFFFFCITLGLELSDTKVYEP